MKNEVIINKVYQNILEHYSNKESYEMCALLIGKGTQVNHIYFTKNTDKSPVHFTISSEQLLNGYKYANYLDMDVIGIFHSHPNNKAWPSITDEKFMKTNTGVWIIYSGIDKNMKAFILNEKQIPEEITINNPGHIK